MNQETDIKQEVKSEVNEKYISIEDDDVGIKDETANTALKEIHVKQE